jgi:hypothetical protein
MCEFFLGFAYDQVDTVLSADVARTIVHAFAHCVRIPVLERHANVDLGSAISYAQEQTSDVISFSMICSIWRPPLPKIPSKYDVC